MDRIRIRSDAIGTLKKQHRFKLAVQLSRLLNVIRSSQRHYLRIENNADPANTRDRLELILYHGAIVFEAVKSVLEHSRELMALPTWSQEAEKVHRIQHEHNDQNSFTRRYLSIVRNRILFHYDSSVIEEVLDAYPLSDGAVFAAASSESTMDLAFLLADELLINYLVRRIEEPVPDADKWGLFEDSLISISNDLADVLYGFVLDLLQDCIYIDEG